MTANQESKKRVNRKQAGRKRSAKTGTGKTAAKKKARTKTGSAPAPADVERRRRVVIEGVEPEIDGGRFPVKRVVGDRVMVEADIFADGHDALCARLLWRHEAERTWNEVPFIPLVNDRWRSEFRVARLGRYRYTIQAWVDPFESWRQNMTKKQEAKQATQADLEIGLRMIREAEERAGAGRLTAFIKRLDGGKSLDKRITEALDPGLAALVRSAADTGLATLYEKQLEVKVDAERAAFSAWYEMFPRSCSPEPGRHGTFRDCEKRLPYIAKMGFDVLYLPPIHPIGRSKRRGKNNAPAAVGDDVGSPWAIGSREGGHKAIHPDLGTPEDLRRLVKEARKLGIEVALDLAYQCSPDHPYVKDHPEWFVQRPDGTIQYAENPPKKYEDIYPLNFEGPDRQGLWDELKSVVDHWIDQGVRIFRVDNPHTKPFAFWEWMIRETHKAHPDVVFLAEAFTRPKVMYHLAKLGFTQSYTYFAWRNAKWELEQYMRELTETQVKEYFRPNFWPNTPDILTEMLQTGGRPAFVMRAVLAATLSSSYGVYGPAFELCESTPREPGSEEYLDSEKYQLRHWDLEQSHSLRDVLERLNRIRRDLAVFRRNDNLRFHSVDNDNIICYSKTNEDAAQSALMVVNLDPHHTQSGWVDLSLETLGLEPGDPFQVHDLLGEGRFRWEGSRNYVELNPHVLPAHVFAVRRKVRREQDFEYFV